VGHDVMKQGPHTMQGTYASMTVWIKTVPVEPPVKADLLLCCSERRAMSFT
jgi:hypothetical protein